MPPAPCPKARPGQRTLLGYPFFRSYGVNLPSSLTEDRSHTWRSLPLPTSVGLRYGRHSVYGLEAFLGGLGVGRLPAAHRRLVSSLGLTWGPDLPEPRPTLANPPCPFGWLAYPAASPHRTAECRCRNIQPAVHRLRL